MDESGGIRMNLEKAISKIAKFDVKEKELDRYAEAIKSSMPFGQPYPIYLRTLDKINEIRAKKAKIWNNELRNYILPTTTKTLWQIAIGQKLPACRFGEEAYLDFYAEDLRRALREQLERAKKEKEVGKEKWKKTKQAEISE